MPHTDADASARASMVRTSTAATTATTTAITTVTTTAIKPATTTAITTAGVIERLSRHRRTTRDLAPLGIALNHFTDLLLEHTDCDVMQAHRATTILTKQIAEALESAEPLDALVRLLDDPDRIATADGRTARELCGAAWDAIRASAHERGAAALDGISEYGIVTVLRLAALHAAGSEFPWWGTPAWRQRVDAWLADLRPAPLLRSALLRAPEHVDDHILADVIR